MPRPLVWLGVLALLAGALLLLRQPLWDRLDLETKHRIVAVYSRWTARPVDTADTVPTSPQVQNRIGVNVFLDQEVSHDDRRRSLELYGRPASAGFASRSPGRRSSATPKGTSGTASGTKTPGQTTTA